MSCLDVVNNLPQADADWLIERIDSLVAGGMKPSDAQRVAAIDFSYRIDGERVALLQSLGAPLLSKREPFYSALLKGVEAVPAVSMPAVGWADAIKGLVSKGAAKADEVEWSGVSDWLGLQKGKVTREAVADYLKANGVERVAIAAYQSGLSQSRAAQIVGVSQATVGNWLRKNGVESRPYIPRQPRIAEKTQDSKLNEIAQDYRSGMGYRAISDKHGVSSGTINRALRRFGIEPRTSGPAGLDAAVREEAVRLYVEGYSAPQIANRLGLSQPSVSRYVRAAGVGRSMSESVAIATAERGGDTARGISSPFQSSKDGSWHFAASSFELARMLQIDSDPGVLAWRKSKLRIPYGDGRTYLPDLEVEYSDGGKFIEEIRPVFRLGELTEKVEAARPLAKEMGMTFRVITEYGIGVDAFIDLASNIEILPQEKRDRVLEQVNQVVRRMRSAQEQGVEGPGILFSRMEELTPVDDETDELLQEYGRVPENRIDAEKAFNDGARVFGFHEQDDRPSEFTSIRQLQAFTPDQMMILDSGLPLFSRAERGDTRAAMATYMKTRNKGLSRVSGASVLESDISSAVEAIDYVVDRIRRGDEERVEVPIGPVPHTLTMLGAPTQMMNINASIIKKVLVEKHSEDFVAVSTRQFVEAIYKPALVMQLQRAGEFEVMSDLLGKSGPIMFAIKTNHVLPDGSTKVSSVASAYSMPITGGGKTVLNAAIGGKVLYAELGPARAAINDWWAQFHEPTAKGPDGGSVNQSGRQVNHPAVKAISEQIVAGVANKRIKTDIDRDRFIGDNFKAQGGNWSDAPSFSRKQGQYKLSDFSKFNQSIEAIQDRYNRWKQAVDQIREQGGTISEENDFYRAEERYWGVVGAQLDDFKGDVESFINDIIKDGLRVDDVALYAYAQHAKERNDWIASQRQTMPDGGSGMTTQDAADLMDEARQAGLEAVLQKHTARMRSMIQGTRDLMLNEGLIDQAEHAAWSSMFQFYVPLRGLEGAPERRGTGMGFDIKGRESRAAMGRKSRAEQIVEQVIQDRTRATVRAGKNQVLRSFLSFVLDNPSPNLWEVEAVEKKAKIKVDANGNRVIEEELQVVTDDRTVTVKDGGQEIHILIHDERLRAQMKNLNAEDISAPVASLLFVNRQLSRVYTSLNPVFVVLNGARDFTAASIGMIDEVGFSGTARLWANMAPSIWQAYQAEFGNMSKDYLDYRNSGGKTGFFDLKTLDAQTDELVAMVRDAEAGSLDPMVLGKKTLGFIESLNGGIENATRLAAFKTARQSGMSIAQAASLSKNITVNFNRKGTMTTNLSAFFLFFNPAVQGTARVVQAIKSPKVMATLGAGMVGIAALAMRNAAMGDDDDGVAWWDKIPDEVKERNIIVVLPPGVEKGDAVPESKTGRYLKIPMPYGYNFFAVLANQAADVYRNSQDVKRGRSLTEGAVSAADAFMGAWIPMQELGKSFKNPQALGLLATPDAFNPLMQVALNVSPFGRALRPDDNDPQRAGLPDSTNYFGAQAGTLYQKAAEGLNSLTGGDKFRSGMIDVAPSTLETLARGYGGGPVGFATDVLNSIYLRHTIKRDDIRPESAPFMKQLYGVIDAETDRMVGYERLQKATDIVGPAKLAQKDADEGDESIEKMEEEFGPMLQLGGQIKVTRKQLSTIRKEELKVVSSDESDSAKYAQLVELSQRRREVLQEFNAAFDEARTEQAAEEKSKRKTGP